MVDYITTNQFYNISEGSSIIEAVAGSLKFTNRTQIYDQNEILNLFMTSCTFENSVIRNINFATTPIKVTASTMELHDMLITDIQDGSDREIFLVNDESQFIVDNVTYQNSNTKFLRALAGQADMNSFTARNITNFANLLQIYSLEKASFNNFTLENLDPKSEQIIQIEKSQNISFNTFSISAINKVVVDIASSFIESISNMYISGCLKALNVISSEIKLLSSSSFTSNGQQDNISMGGAIFLSNSKINISGTTFSNNTAGKAGAIAFECDSPSVCSLSLENSTFINNKASVEGGAIHYNLKRPDILDTVFTNNSAQYGNDLASYPIKVRIKDQPTSFIKLTNIGSGVSIPSPIEFALLDYDNQVVNLNNEDQIGIFALSGSNSTVGGVNSFNFRSGIATVEGIIFANQPGARNVMFDTNTDAIDKSKVATAFPGQDFNSDITVDFRFCEPGEEITAQGTCRE